MNLSTFGRPAPPSLEPMRFTKKKRHEETATALTDPAAVFSLEAKALAGSSDDDWILYADAERLNPKKKIDANDIVAEGGREGFLKFLVETPTPVFHQKISKIVKLSRLWQCYPDMRQPIIHGILRRGEIMNLVAAPKTNKSWMALDAAMAVISGGRFFGRFDCTRGRVLIIDNELHEQTISMRSKTVAAVMNVPGRYAGNLIDYMPLRGELADIYDLRAFLDDIPPRAYAMCVCDALYRLYPSGMDENDNAEMARLYNHLDLYAGTLDAAFVMVHHTSKFSQVAKAVTDVGAGAGSLTRACDAHMIIRPHRDEDQGVVRIDVLARSFPPLDPFCAKFKYPVWQYDPNSDPDDLPIPPGGTEEKTARKAVEALTETARIETFLLQTVTRPMSIADMLTAGAGQNFKPWNRDRFARGLLPQMLKDGKLRLVDGATGRKAATYQAVPKRLWGQPQPEGQMGQPNAATPPQAQEPPPADAPDAVDEPGSRDLEAEAALEQFEPGDPADEFVDGGGAE